MYKWYLSGSLAYHNFKKKYTSVIILHPNHRYIYKYTQEDINSIERNSLYAKIFLPAHHRPKFPLEVSLPN